jgi:class 3 adenylate cyclase
MALSSTLPIAPEERVLAAIVFTDVAGFSARMQKEETATLALLERDFATMRAFSEQLSGAVLKTTGDGLLLYFTSAVQAVSWALAVQRLFREQAKTTPPAEILRHRIGVHLGDVFVRADDVMGDGVNIAARVQAEAPAGGICISQVVYDVVKAKLKLDVVRLEPRKLKNIFETIQMYHLLLEPPVKPVLGGRAVFHVPVIGKSRPPKKRKLTGIVGLLGLMAGLGWMITRSYLEHQNELARSQAAHVALGALLESKNPVDATVGSADAASPALPTPVELDFAKMAAAEQVAGPKDVDVLREANQCVQMLEAWLTNQLPRFTRDRPLIVRPLRDASSQDMTIFTDSLRRLYFEKGGAVRKQDWDDLKPEVQGAIIVSTLRDLPATPPPDVVRGADAFAYVHRLPEMAATLIRDRRPGLGRAP